jgi:hypothetical protein
VTNVMGRDMVCNVGGTKGVAGVCEVQGTSQVSPLTSYGLNTLLTAAQPAKGQQSRCTSNRTTEIARANR